MSYKFFQNTECPYFPCHKGVKKEEFNCLFCYCPLYALGRECGGNFAYLDSGIKSCMGCSKVHKSEQSYEHVMSKIGLLIEKFGQE